MFTVWIRGCSHFVKLKCIRKILGPGKSVHYRGCSHFRGVHIPRFHCIYIKDGDREPVHTGLSIAVNQSKTGPPSTRFGFLCMHRVPGGVIKLSAPTSSLASQCLPSETIKQPFQNLSSLVPCPLSLCSEAF